MKQPILRGPRRLHTRGVTLFEVLIVVTILALIAAGVALAALKFLEIAKIRQTETNARAIRGAVRARWAVQSSTECPGVDELIRDGTLDRDSARRDAWDGQWSVECAERDVTVTSAGPDRKVGTDDDIRIPPA